jgi:hypothetical protein
MGRHPERALAHLWLDPRLRGHEGCGEVVRFPRVGRFRELWARFLGNHEGKQPIRMTGLVVEQTETGIVRTAGFQPGPHRVENVAASKRLRPPLP